jgi:uncharacterized membrane protein YfcA
MPAIDPMVLGLLMAGSFVAAVMQASTGFGFAVLAVPVFLMLLPAREAVQINILLSCLVMAVMTAGLWRGAPWRLIGMVSLGTVIGAPLGLYFLTQAPDQVVRATVGGVLAVLLAYILWRRRTRPVSAGDRPPPRPALEAVAGLFGGALGAGIGMPGPPLLVYFGLAGGGKDIARPAIMAYLLIAFLGIAGLNLATVGLAGPVLSISAWLVPAALAGCAAGAWLSRHINQRRFDIVTLGALGVTTAAMLWAVATG